MFQTLLSAARNLCGEKRQEIQKCFWSQIQVMNVAGRSLHLLQNHKYCWKSDARNVTWSWSQIQVKIKNSFEISMTIADYEQSQ